jgi:hypothetical protein
MSTSEENTTKCKFAKEEEERWRECGENVPESRTKHELYMFKEKARCCRALQSRATIKEDYS